MTTKPYLVALALCLGGMVATGLPLAALALGWNGWAFLGWGAGLGGFVFLGVCAAGIQGEHGYLTAQRYADLKRQQISNAEREWALKSARRQADAASGLTGAREAEALERRWQVGAEILFRAIDKAGGASGRKLAGVVGSDAHPALMAFYTSPSGLCILRDAGGNVGHTWGYRETGEAWTLDDVLALIRAGKLPHPDSEPPEINPLPPSAAQRSTPRKSATQKKAERPEKGAGAAVVEGVVTGREPPAP